MSSKVLDCDIDLYADVSEFKDEFNQDGNLDLYDDVITASTEIHDNEDRPSRSQSASPFHFLKNNRRFFAVYVGNLTWWTTDQNLIDALRIIGVHDVVEVKFFENRANGQSKGYCVIALGSEKSVKIVMDKFSDKEIHGQKPQVLTYTKQNLSYFENQSRKNGRRDQENVNERKGRDKEMHDRPPRVMQNERYRGKNDHCQTFSLQQQPHPHMPQLLPRGPLPQYLPGQSQWASTHPLQAHQMSQSPRPGIPPNIGPSLPSPFQNIPPPNVITPGNLRLPPPNNARGPIPAIVPRQFTPSNLRGLPPHDWEHPNVSHPPPIGVLPHSLPPARPPPPFQNVSQTTPVLPHQPHSMYFHSQNVSGYISTSQASNSYGRPFSTEFSNYSSYKQESSVSEIEFEEIMSRNKTVASSAITRAVSDASVADYASAIETLVTAISLIKQSKIATDERCKILVCSLQDTLHSIESKSYGSRSKERPRSRERERPRSRERERSHDRSSKRDKGSRRELSRSRDRDYGDRNRERHHEDRYRDKDRDHDHRSARH